MKSAIKPRKQATSLPDPQTLAATAVSRYFQALAAEVPYDNAPGDVDLSTAFTSIQDAVEKHQQRERPDLEVDNEDTAMRAGYLLGVEVGRRLGGAR